MPELSEQTEWIEYSGFDLSLSPQSLVLHGHLRSGVQGADK